MVSRTENATPTGPAWLDAAKVIQPSEVESTWWPSAGGTTPVRKMGSPSGSQYAESTS